MFTQEELAKIVIDLCDKFIVEWSKKFDFDNSPNNRKYAALCLGRCIVSLAAVHIKMVDVQFRPMAIDHFLKELAHAIGVMEIDELEKATDNADG